ncbi:MAG: chemotaxis protein CheW [Gammaproteobacteria bacterium]
MIECVTFFLAGDKYAVDIMRIREVREWESVRDVPNSTDEIIGIIDIRGKIVPILDLKQKFGFGANEIDDDKAVIILKSVESRLGFIVDSVSDIEKLSDKDIKDINSFNQITHTDYIKSVFTKDKTVIMMLDVDQLFQNSSDQNELLN